MYAAISIIVLFHDNEYFEQSINSIIAQLKDGDEIIVSVGSVAHPMDDDHYINWIALVNDDVVTRVNLNPNDEPEARFPYTKGSIVYAYCDKHGLWKAIVD